MGCSGMGWDGMGWDGMGWDGMGDRMGWSTPKWDAMERHGHETGRTNPFMKQAVSFSVHALFGIGWGGFGLAWLVSVIVVN